jgi:hypothetical protein
MSSKKKVEDVEILALKEFLLDHFDFDGLKELGFFGKDIKRREYQKQADRICFFFGYSSVFEYALQQPIAVHLTENTALFNCPICTCKQDVPDSNKIVYKIKCAGCKRPLNVVDTYTKGFIISNPADEKEIVYTRNDRPKMFVEII